jgi:hypothetical protein
MCDAAADIVTVWYSVNLAQAGSTLATLIGNNIPLFTSEYYANLYANGLNSELEGLIPSGLYAENTAYDDPTAIFAYYKRSVDNIWVNSPETGSIIWKCPASVTYDSYSISSVDIPINSATSVHNLCEGSTSSTTIWYAVAQDSFGLSEGKSLLEIIQQNIPIYMSQEGLEGEIISDMWPTGAFSVNGEYGVWTNEEDGINFKWYAFNSNDQFVEGHEATRLGNCDNYVRPTVSLPEDLEWNSGVNDTNVFYAFMNCAPSTETDNENGLISNYW